MLVQSFLLPICAGLNCLSCQGAALQGIQGRSYGVIMMSGQCPLQRGHHPTVPEQGERAGLVRVTQPNDLQTSPWWCSKSEITSTGRDQGQAQAYLQHSSGRDWGQALWLKYVSPNRACCSSLNIFCPSSLNPAYAAVPYHRRPWAEATKPLGRGQRLQSKEMCIGHRPTCPAGWGGHIFCRTLSNGEHILILKTINMYKRQAQHQSGFQPLHTTTLWLSVLQGKVEMVTRLLSVFEKINK